MPILEKKKTKKKKLQQEPGHADQQKINKKDLEKLVFFLIFLDRFNMLILKIIFKK
jgi:hypothetical protein